MAFIPTPHSVRVVVRWSATGAQFSNVWHFSRPDFLTTEQEDFAELVNDNIATNFKPLMSTDTSYLGTDVYDIRTSTGLVYTNTEGAGPGTQSDDVIPINVSLCITLRTATRGRTGRGRTYFAGMGEASIVNGVWDGTIAAAFVSSMGALKTACDQAGWQWCIRSVQVDGQQLTTAIMRPVTLIESRNTTPTTQRKRLDRP